MAQPAVNRSSCRPSIQIPPYVEAEICLEILHNLPQAVLLLDAELRVVSANRAAQVIFRPFARTLVGHTITAIVGQRNLDHLLADLNDRPRVIELSLPAANRCGELRLKIKAVRLSRDGRGQAFKLLTVENISDTAELELLLVETEKQAAMGQLAAGILHEVANPLMSLGSNLIYVRGVLSQLDNADIATALDVSLEQLEQMRQLLGTLSGLPGRPAPRYEAADVHELVRRCVTFVAKEAERRHVALGVHFAAGTVSCEIDARLIKQVLLNLLKNAMEAMPHGGRVDVTTRCTPDERAPDSVTIEIADTGVGIPESDLRKVFRPLFSTKARGAGLGLSFCRQAVEEHGGEIRLNSRGNGRGTVAVVTLPVRQTTTD
jgi:signal transduction histidine kinase